VSASGAKNLPVERIALDRVALPAAKQADEALVREYIRELARNRGAEKLGQYEDVPVFVRVGERLIPISGHDAKIRAADALGMKTMDARVIDLNEALRAKAIERNAIESAAGDKIKAAHAAEVARRDAEHAERLRAEAVGKADIVAIRAKHQPPEYAKQYEAVYKEAAPSLGWGRAMHARGLDFPLSHLDAVVAKAGHDESVKDHPVGFLKETLAKARASGAGTLREALEAAERDLKLARARRDAADAGSSEAERAALHKAYQEAKKRVASINEHAALGGHLDAIRPHREFAVTAAVSDGRDESAQKAQIRSVAEITDRSVRPPTITVVADTDGRAWCRADEKLAEMGLDKKESTSVVFHETGHAIEGSDRSRAIRASAFLDARAGDEKPRTMNEIMKSDLYDKKEIAVEDKFSDAYVGKDYGRDPKLGSKTSHGRPGTEVPHRGTEITSMAIQRTAEPGRSRATDDFEHYLFGLGQLGGY
jgi:hypothetical protein